MKNTKKNRQKILNVLYILAFIISELRKPGYNPLGFLNFLTKEVTIYQKPSMALIHLSANDSKGVELLHLIVGSDRRFLEFLFLNSRLLPITTAMEIIYGLLKQSEAYLKFSDKKVIITYIIGIEEIDHGDGYPESRKFEITLHQNTVVTNNTTWGAFYSFIRSHIKQSYLDGYNFDTPTMFRVKIWDVDHLANKQIKNSGGTLTVIDKLQSKIVELGLGSHTGINLALDRVAVKAKARAKANAKSSRISAALRKYLKDHGRGYSTMATSHNQYNQNLQTLNKNQLINPLTRRPTKPSPFATMDIETITYQGQQLPILISVKFTSQVKVFKLKKIDRESAFLCG